MDMIPAAKAHPADLDKRSEFEGNEKAISALVME